MSANDLFDNPIKIEPDLAHDVIRASNTTYVPITDPLGAAINEYNSIKCPAVRDYIKLYDDPPAIELAYIHYRRELKEFKNLGHLRYVFRVAAGLVLKRTLMVAIYDYNVISSHGRSVYYDRAKKQLVVQDKKRTIYMSLGTINQEATFAAWEIVLNLPPGGLINYLASRK